MTKIKILGKEFEIGDIVEINEIDKSIKKVGYLLPLKKEWNSLTGKIGENIELSCYIEDLSKIEEMDFDTFSWIDNIKSITKIK